MSDEERVKGYYSRKRQRKKERQKRKKKTPTEKKMKNDAIEKVSTSIANYMIERKYIELNVVTREYNQRGYIGVRFKENPDTVYGFIAELLYNWSGDTALKKRIEEEVKSLVGEKKLRKNN